MSGAAVSMREVIQTLSSSIRPLLLTPRGSATAFLRGTIEEIFQLPGWRSLITRAMDATEVRGG